jgi:hypothetical protein
MSVEPKKDFYRLLTQEKVNALNELEKNEETKKSKKIKEIPLLIEDKDIQYYKNFLIKFINDGIDEYELERITESDLNFKNYDDFKEFQTKHIESIDKKEINRLIVLINFIRSGMFIMDKESMVAFESSGFCFNSDGKLIVFNER